LAERAQGQRVGVRCEIVDAETMEAAAAECRECDVVVAAFRDETNIPLELLLATAQGSRATVVKELRHRDEAATVAGVLESGPSGLALRGEVLRDLETVIDAVARSTRRRHDLQALTVPSTRQAGLGFRGCVDTTTLFDEDEGMIVGSTSHGGILVCAEVHHLPYMNLRPFRVNAGAVHSYVYGMNDRTNYLTELKAGSPAMVVGVDGSVREVPVGRIKTEIRPLRLIEVEFEGGERANVIMQDDWHVRIFSADGKPLNITELKPGDKVLGHVASPGRHVGLPVDESIEEA